MIFKTFDNDIDKWTAKIGIFGKSFNELGNAVRDAFKTTIDNIDNFDEDISFWDALNTAIVMTVLNIILKPIIVILTLPLTIMTFGLFYVVVNGFLLWVADYLMGPSFEINSFGLAILASVFISLLRMGINHYILKEDSLFVIELVV